MIELKKPCSLLPSTGATHHAKGLIGSSPPSPRTIQSSWCHIWTIGSYSQLNPFRCSTFFRPSRELAFKSILHPTTSLVYLGLQIKTLFQRIRPTQMCIAHLQYLLTPGHSAHHRLFILDVLCHGVACLSCINHSSTITILGIILDSVWPYPSATEASTTTHIMTHLR
jgi:hypothetical protein